MYHALTAFIVYRLVDNVSLQREEKNSPDLYDQVNGGHNPLHAKVNKFEAENNLNIRIAARGFMFLHLVNSIMDFSYFFILENSSRNWRVVIDCMFIHSVLSLV